MTVSYVCRIRMNALQVAEALVNDVMAMEKFKTDVKIPMEKSLIPKKQHVDFLDKIPESSHLRDHWNYFNQEQMNIVKTALAGDLTSLEIVENRTVQFGGTTIDQYKFRLKTPVWSRRVWLPVEMMDKAILHRRHTQTPSVDFIVSLTKDVMVHMTKVDTQILTIRRGDPPIPGTGFAGNHFPGSVDSDDFTGILYKWYKTVEDRVCDIEAFRNGIHTKIPALIDAEDYQRLVLG